LFPVSRAVFRVIECGGRANLEVGEDAVAAVFLLLRSGGMAFAKTQVNGIVE